jgi:hypothetical protein
MIKRYYATDCKVKPNSDKDIKVIREEDFNSFVKDLKLHLDDYDNVSGLIDMLSEIKDCFGDE